MDNTSKDSLEQLNKDILVSIADDCMTAYICLKNPGTEICYGYEDVKKALADAGVKMGINDELIHRILSEKRYNSMETVAEGKHVEDGEDARYQLFFNTDVSNKPVIREDGSVDYYNLRLYELVSEGDKLAEYIPPTKGVFGYDVRGKLLVPKPGKPKTKLRGKGFTVSEDGNTYYSAIDGKVEYRNTDLNVIGVLQIEGDVDLNIGNVDFNGDVEISGNVISGVSVTAKGNVTVGGFVECAVIKADKDIILKKGSNGKGVAKIEAKGNVTASFLENLRVYCDGNVYSNSILNCEISAKGKVIVSGSKGVIYGGDVTGMLGVESASIGNSSNVSTIVRIGAAKQVHKDYQDTLVKLKEITAEIDTLEIVTHKYERLREAAPERFDRENYNKIIQSKIIKNSQKAKLQEENKQLFDLIKEATISGVTVYKTLYPGVRIYAENVIYDAQTERNHIRLRRVGDAMRIIELGDDE